MGIRLTNENNEMFADLSEHIGHDITCVAYADGANVAIECKTCNAVLVDADSSDKRGTLWIRRPGAEWVSIGIIAFFDYDDDAVSDNANSLCMALVRNGFEVNIEHEMGAIFYDKSDLNEDEA